MFGGNVESTSANASPTGKAIAGDGPHKDHELQTVSTPSGTSPFEAGGLLFVYAREGGLNVYEAASGKHIATLPCGPGHWNSPIVLQGEIILPEGNANDHATRGVLDIWNLPSGN